jgi:hypothetical protein
MKLHTSLIMNETLQEIVENIQGIFFYLALDAKELWVQLILMVCATYECLLIILDQHIHRSR